MANVLEKIVIDKKAEIAQRKIDFPLSEFKHTLSPSNKDFYAALAAPNASFILECKKASPSKGLIREHFDLDEIIGAYSKHASCISVLTDEKYFQGKFEYLEYVATRVQQPVINKDFFVDPYQIYLARYYQADAVLLMLSVLDDDTYTELSSLAKTLNLAVLTEVSNEEETNRALRLGANIIGINNRNLRDLSTDLATTERLVPMINASGFDGVIISESGIYTHPEVRRLSPLVDAFLVGSALMAQDELEKAIEQLIYGEVKVCGITSPEQAQMVSQFPVSYLGAIFVEKSPRYVSQETAKAICKATNLPLVGVYQNHSIEQILADVNAIGLSAVQLHGDETQAFIDELRQGLEETTSDTANSDTTCQIWKVISVEHKKDLSSVQDYRADKLLLDTKTAEQSGGTGLSFDWQWLDALKDKTNIVLAGGIKLENANAARQTQVQVIDLNSGVEADKGVKSEEMLQAIFLELRKY